ncbi:cupredoxin domain-containing protein [Chromobacterium subtsugae]|uniref:Cupredoxin domain-containing protein n=1 Tax=Chromobacterium subtsugae TaxID=251747 RepID=A0ABS7FFE1_9NEIS|nr:MULTISPECIES: cupredoxin domain-containing protein [Chromobacterium]KUM02028.1 periplasmic lipoprotein involved in iron transport [Chromobacterium subtsugae]KZE85447.1 periplasmic lipoprotein involved in iron transport [Chromobacterium sp. F49]MBW7567589.1 cupredoxin domain-containing protein [Chromobacterium subtsugae]MBW8288783.1 cupredoxin domain-containing protein [Chromobacterium subtsugae]WSE92385.1 cupredoxin domain-containing protein [Chromobacterium subtsugae]
MTVLRLLAAALLAGLFSASALAEEMPVFKLEIKDGYFKPARLVVPAGKKFKVDVMNTGKTPAEFESTPLRKEKVLGPGAESFLVFQPLSPGEYKFFDEFHMKTGQGVIVAK